MAISISKKDIIWSYIAQFFSLASGLIVLPLVLRMLSTEEVAMNYLMLTIGSLVALFDFGFAPQFGRNITYVFSGVSTLQKESIECTTNETVNYKLLATMISTARFVYRRLALLVLLLMLTLGTLYIHKVTDGFTMVEHSFIIWVLFSISVFLNIYYSYYNSLLVGKGLITESKKAMILSKVSYILIAAVTLYLGVGLVGLVLANLISPFVSRFISHIYFFTPEIKQKIKQEYVTKQDKKDLFVTIWYNSKKLGLVFIGGYAISKSSIFIAGLFLSLEEIASYGLMIQLVWVIMAVSTTFFNSINPMLSSLRVNDNKDKLLRIFGLSMTVYYIIFIISSVLLIFIAPYILVHIGSNVKLPSTTILIIYCVVIFLEGNHSSFATMIVMRNSVPFVESSLIAGFFIVLGDFLVLSYTSWSILGLVLVQGITQIVYANWKWPYVICNEFNISFLSFLRVGTSETLKKIKSTIYVNK